MYKKYLKLGTLDKVKYLKRYLARQNCKELTNNKRVPFAYLRIKVDKRYLSSYWPLEIIMKLNVDPF